MADQENLPNNPVREPAAPGGAAGAPPSAAPATPPSQQGAGATAPSAGDGGAAPGEIKTVLDDTGEPEAPTTVPADWPANWAEIMAGGDPKKVARFKRFGSPVALGNSWLSAQQKISEGQRAKPDGSDPQALEAWRAEVGIPAKPEGYLEKMPGGLAIGQEDQDLVSSFLERAHGKDVPPALVHDFLGWHQEQREKLAAEIVAGDKQDRTNAEDSLRPEWGAEYRGNITGVTNFVATHGTGELLQIMAGARCDDGVLLGNKPEFWRMMVALDKEVNPAGTVVPTAGLTALGTIKERKAALEREMQDSKARDPNGYWANPAKQQEYRNLLEQEARYERRAG